MEDNEHPPAPVMEASAPEVVERPLWVLSRDEQRVLIITFVGGLASIVAGVRIVGGAIALARLMRVDGNTLSGLILATASNFITIAFAIKGYRSSSRGARRKVLLIAGLGAGVLLSIFLLALIGLAAGIH